MNTRVTLTVTAACATATAGQPDVPPGFAARLIAPLLDGSIPQLSAIDDPQFGTGVVTAVAGGGVVTVRLVEPSGVLRSIGVWSGAPASGAVIRVSLDQQHIIDGLLHTSVRDSVERDSHYLTVDSSGSFTEWWERTDYEGYQFAFTAGNGGNPVGAVLLDGDSGGGTKLGWMGADYLVTIVDEDSVPPGRTDTDIQGLRPDVTSAYGGGLLLADTDINTNAKTAIYELREVLAGGSYRAIYGPVSSDIKRYGDLGIAAAGDFGGVIYVTETLADEIQQVAPDGAHTTWATGFVGIASLSISPDGNSMYVGDLNGVWIIRASGNEPGPVVLATDPSVPPTSQLTGAPISSFRVIFNEPVNFTDSDVAITNANGDPVGFDASGSASQFMLVGLADPLFGDTYTLTIADTVTSVATGEALDGDNDGFAGGDSVLTFTHRCPGDFNADGTINTIDVLQFLNAWTAGCP